MVPLSENRVDLWITRPEECQDPSLLAAYQRLMDQSDRAEWSRYRVGKKRQEHLVARALLRTVLSEYAGIPPQEWRFVRSSSGKPGIDWPALKDRWSGLPGEAFLMEFNLSHTDNMIICAVIQGAPIGVDVEDNSRSADFLPLARRFFAPREVALLESLPPPARQEGFYRLWTLKEAYLKAQGAGLTVHLDKFSFRWRKTALPPQHPVAIPSDVTPVELTSSAQEAPQLLLFSPAETQSQDWQLREFLLEGRFQVALAVARPSHLPLAITLRKTIPLKNPPSADSCWENLPG